jgi:hypothetical protein
MASAALVVMLLPRNERRVGEGRISSDGLIGLEKP